MSKWNLHVNIIQSYSMTQLNTQRNTVNVDISWVTRMTVTTQNQPAARRATALICSHYEAALNAWDEDYCNRYSWRLSVYGVVSGEHSFLSQLNSVCTTSTSSQFSCMALIWGRWLSAKWYLDVSDECRLWRGYVPHILHSQHLKPDSLQANESVQSHQYYPRPTS